MKKTKKVIIRRSSDFTGGDFGFTLRHFVIYPPSVSVNDIVRASYSVVIDEHQQKQLDGGGGTTATAIPSSIVPSALLLSSSSSGLIHHQGEQQRSSSASVMKTLTNDNIQEDGTILTNNPNLNLQSMDTIFVKEVRVDGPAYGAGLRHGDQILTVNDQSINGKTYSQVIAMIQNTSADLVLNVVPKEEEEEEEDDTRILNSTEKISSNINLNESRTKPIQHPRSSSYHPSTVIMSNNNIEHKLRNLQMNIAHGRNEDELAQSGIYFPQTSSQQQQQQQNLFSNYIDSVHRALDSSKETRKGDSTPLYYESPYHSDYVQYDYKSEPSFQINFNQQSNFINNNDSSTLTLPNLIRPPVPPRQNQSIRNPLNTFINVPSNRLPFDSIPRPSNWNYGNPTSNSMITESPEEQKSPSTEDSIETESPPQLVSNEKNALNEADMKTEFVNFRKKQFETGHVENVVHDPQRESKTKQYSEKKKYENEWNRLTAIADVESVMERASHFEDIDPDKFARLKSKLPTSPPIHEKLNTQNNFIYDFNQNYFNEPQGQFKLLKPSTRQSSLDSSSTFSFPRVGELNTIEFNFDPRYIIPQMRTNPVQPLSSSSHFNPLTPNDNSRFPLENYLNNSSSRPTGVNLIRQPSYINAVRPVNQNEQPDFVSQFGNPIASEQEMKQRQRSYLMNNNQGINSNPRDYFPNQSINERNNSSYEILQEQEQKLRNSSHHHHHHQSQAIKRLKNFFTENLSSSHIHNEIEPLSPPSSSGGRSKSGSLFDGAINNPEAIRLTTMTDNIEASKEGILYCKTVLKEGRRATDRSWRGAWAVLRPGALFLGKEKKHGLLIPLSFDSFPINLRNAKVVASNYVKKPRVFQLTTSNQSEFLFQAPDLQSLNEWLDLINEHCISSESQQDEQIIQEKRQRKSTASLPPIAPQRHQHQQELLSENPEKRKSKSKVSIRSPSLKRSPSLRFRKSKKSSIIQPAQAPPLSLSGSNSPPNSNTPRRSFVKSIVKKGIQTIISPARLLASPMSGQIYDESSGETLSSTSATQTIIHGVNFAIELEECEISSVSRYIPIVVEILTRLIELRGINYQGIYRHAGASTSVNWLINQLDKGTEKIDFNSEKWYDVKAIASTLKTFFAKLPDSLLSSRLSCLSVEASRIENHCERLIELKKLLVQLDDYQFETLKYLCAHFRRVTSKCDINKIDARNLAIIIGPTLIWDSKASLQSNLVDNPEKIRIIESFILYYEWFFDENSYDSIPAEINPQMPRLPPVISHGNVDHETFFNNETKPGEIIEHIVRAAKRRWSTPILLEQLSSLKSQTNDQQTSKPMNISVKRNVSNEKFNGSYSLDCLFNMENPRETSQTRNSLFYSMSDKNLTIIKHFFDYFKSKIVGKNFSVECEEPLEKDEQLSLSRKSSEEDFLFGNDSPLCTFELL